MTRPARLPLPACGYRMHAFGPLLGAPPFPSACRGADEGPCRKSRRLATDIPRDEWLRSRGWRILRFSIGGGETVLEQVLPSWVAGSRPRTPPLPARAPL